MEGAHILVIEDDHDIAHLIELHLGEVGFKVAVVHDGLDGLERATEGSHDLIVLDVMLPRLSGTELCQRLRAASNDLLILMLSARGRDRPGTRARDRRAKPRRHAHRQAAAPDAQGV